MKQVITRDGSITFFNEQAQEHYHSHTVGAIEEAFVKYAEPAGLSPGCRVLDICFGLGYNTLAAISLIDNIEVVGLENDRGILEQVQTIAVPEKYLDKYAMIRKAARCLQYSGNGVSIKIMVGDARETVLGLSGQFDAVLFDPFSPKKAPELWTTGFFRSIAQRLNQGARLTTYSCARSVRSNLVNAGFSVEDGPIFGRKSPSTIAIYL